MFEVASLAISQENLDALPKRESLAELIGNRLRRVASNLVPEAMSADNSGDGTASGPCSFAVAGLTGE
jgi:hypothetical protein